MNTNLLYEILLYLNSYYFGMFLICEIAMFLIKVFNLPSRNGSYEAELAILFFLSFLEAIRIFLGRKGNLTENGFTVLLSIALTVPTALGVIYYLLWQSYILRLERILCIIQLSLYVAETLLGSLTLLPIFKSASY